MDIDAIDALDIQPFQAVLVPEARYLITQGPPPTVALRASRLLETRNWKPETQF